MGELEFAIPEMHDSVPEFGGAGKSPEGPKGNEDGPKTLQSKESSLTNTMAKDTITPTSMITSLCNMTSIMSLYLLLVMQTPVPSKMHDATLLESALRPPLKHQRSTNALAVSDPAGSITLMSSS